MTRCGVADLKGEDFVARVRLSDPADNTLAAPGETCERVPASPRGGTVSDALAKLLVSGCIEAAPARARRGAAKEK